jgi:hypothetical protein
MARFPRRFSDILAGEIRKISFEQRFQLREAGILPTAPAF